MCAALVLALASASLLGQQYEVERQLVWPGGGSGERPTIGSDGNIYAVGGGGEFGRGEIFRLVPDGIGGLTYERLYSFHGPDGTGPTGIIQGSDGRFYGATTGGGEFAGGTVYAFDPATGSLVVFHSFPVHSFYGFYYPSRLIQASDGNFYGLTVVGGTIGFGTIFRVTPSGEFTEIHVFTGPDGERPWGPLMQASDGYLYGGAQFGGNFAGQGPTGLGYSGGGTLFRSDLSGNTTAIYKFPGHDNYINAELLETPDGNLWGTSVNYGTSGQGSVFRSDKAGNVTVIHSFPSAPGEGVLPIAGLTRTPDGTFYGITTAGGAGGAGTVFRMTTDGTVTTVASFGPDLLYPAYGLTLEPAGTILGVATNGGAFARGAMFRVPLPGTGYQVIRDYGAPAVAMNPASQLVQTADGTLWGTAGGGSANLGTIYRLSGAPMLAYEFSGATDGASPGNLFAGADGSLYGVTANQGPGGSGTIFKLDAGGTFTTLHAFSGLDGAEPAGGLMQASDGNFYGTTAFGGTDGGGTLFRLTSSGTHTKLHDFTANAIPEEPRGRLIQASDGKLYFTTFGFHGTVYQSDLDGNLTDLYDFQGGSDGGNPPAGVIQADDGSLYGTCRYWGDSVHSLGTVFRFVVPSTLTVIHSFSGEGRTLGGVVQGSDGRLYGTTTGEEAKSLSHGGVFGVDLSGSGFTMIHEFAAYPDGDTPAASLLRASDGMLYGTTQAGGWSNVGLVFRLDLSGSPPSLTSLAPASGPAQGGVALTILGDHLRPGAAGTIGGASLEGADEFDHGALFALSPVLPPGTVNDVTVTNADGQSATLSGGFFSDFLDAPGGDQFHADIETIFRAGITAGCGAGNYCTDAPASRAQMAVLLLKVEHGPAYVPPPCTGVFPDVACPSLFADWIEQFTAEALTAGCGGGNYCPQAPVRRDQLAVLILKFEHGPAYVPPACTGIFDDVACPSEFADWIEQFAAEKITVGCGNGNYCPDSPTTRGQMAVFLARALAFP